MNSLQTIDKYCKIQYIVSIKFQCSIFVKNIEMVKVT